MPNLKRAFLDFELRIVNGTESSNNWYAIGDVRLVKTPEGVEFYRKLILSTPSGPPEEHEFCALVPWHHIRWVEYDNGPQPETLDGREPSSTVQRSVGSTPPLPSSGTDVADAARKGRIADAEEERRALNEAREKQLATSEAVADAAKKKGEKK